MRSRFSALSIASVSFGHVVGETKKTRQRHFKTSSTGDENELCPEQPYWTDLLSSTLAKSCRKQRENAPSIIYRYVVTFLCVFECFKIFILYIKGFLITYAAMQKEKASASPPAMDFQGRRPQQYPCYSIIQAINRFVNNR